MTDTRRLSPEEIAARVEQIEELIATSYYLSVVRDGQRPWGGLRAKAAAQERRERARVPAWLRSENLDSGPCVYCGDERPTEVDHVIPVAQGGTPHPDNLVPSCKPCNVEKLDFTPEQWRAWREDEGLGWPPESRVKRITRMVEDASRARAR